MQGLSSLCPEFATWCMKKLSVYLYRNRFFSCMVVAFVLLINNELSAATPLKAGFVDMQYVRNELNRPTLCALMWRSYVII